MTSIADTSTTTFEPKQYEIVSVKGREAVFLYRRHAAAIVRYAGEDDSRAVPLSKVSAPPS